MKLLLMTLTFMYCYIDTEIDKSLAGKLFDKSTVLSKPDTLSTKKWTSDISFGITDKPAMFVGTIYSELRNVLNHYFTYFMKNSSEFALWYKSEFYEMNDDTKNRIVNTLNANLHSINDLDSFWTITQSGYLEKRLVDLNNTITKYNNWLTSEGIKHNAMSDFTLTTSLDPETRDRWIIKEASFVADFLAAGLKNHEDGRFTNVFQNFISATVEKKKLDALFEDKYILSSN